jgi:beta-glucosidase-like glycosyl hydrolase
LTNCIRTLSAGITADINILKTPVIGYRSFGENKENYHIFALEYVRLGMNDAGVLSYLKHFSWTYDTSVRIPI